jgi:hypothetical protein
MKKQKSGQNTSKLLFVYNFPKDQVWLDGLRGALELLKKDFEITIVNIRDEFKIDAKKYDFVLGWGAFGSPVDQLLRKLDCKKGLCIAGNAIGPEGAMEYDVLFYETKWYRDQINFHPNIVHAFGINSSVYFDLKMPVPILWDYIGVGSLSNWKRWEKMLDKPGQRLVIGEYQKGNEEESSKIANMLLKGGVAVSPVINPFALSMLYASARKLYIPASVVGGGERAILEARNMGIEVEIEEDNPKLKELLTSPIYDHVYYADKLKKGIESCLS